MNAHEVIASLFAIARNSGRSSKGHAPGTADHEVTETAAVMCAKLALELEHDHHLHAPPHAEVCPRCRGARVLEDLGTGMPAQGCYFCRGAGFLLVAVALVAACLVGCGGAEFFPVDPFALHDGDASGSEPAADGAVSAPGVDAIAPPLAPDVETPEAGGDDHVVMTTPEAAAPEATAPPPVVDAGEPREASLPPLCEPQTCPACAAPASPCCMSTTSCGCVNPSEGGYCR